MYVINGVFDEYYVRHWTGWGAKFSTSDAYMKKFTSWDNAYREGLDIEQSMNVKVAVKKV